MVAKVNNLYLVAVPQKGRPLFAIGDSEPGYATELARLAGELGLSEAQTLERLQAASGRGPSVIVGGVSYYVSLIPF